MRASRGEVAQLAKGFNGGTITRISMWNGTSMATPMENRNQWTDRLLPTGARCEGEMRNHVKHVTLLLKLSLPKQETNGRTGCSQQALGADVKCATMCNMSITMWHPM